MRILDVMRLSYEPPRPRERCHGIGNMSFPKVTYIAIIVKGAFFLNFYLFIYWLFTK